MNPYQPPRTESDERPVDGDRPPPSAFVRNMILAAGGAVSIGVFLNAVGIVGPASFAPPLVALAVSLVAERAPRVHLDVQWTFRAVAITTGALAAYFATTVFVTPGALFRPLSYLFALLIVGSRTNRAERRARELDSLDLRDREQRAHFAEREQREAARPAPKPAITTGLRLACAECGDLTDEAELASVDGRRVCPACA